MKGDCHENVINVVLFLSVLFAAGDAHANDNNLLDFLSGIDKAIESLCNIFTPTTNDLVTGEKTT